MPALSRWRCLATCRFPAITKEPYSLTLAPYSFLWLELQAAGVAGELPPELGSEAHAATEAQRALQRLRDKLGGVSGQAEAACWNRR